MIQVENLFVVNCFFTEAWLLVICRWQCRNIIRIVQRNVLCFFSSSENTVGTNSPTNRMSQMKYGEQNEICGNKVVVSSRLHVWIVLALMNPLCFHWDVTNVPPERCPRQRSFGCVRLDYALIRTRAAAVIVITLSLWIACALHIP